MCVGSEFQVDGAETENAQEVKLLVMPVGLARRFVLEGSGWKVVGGLGTLFYVHIVGIRELSSNRHSGHTWRHPCLKLCQNAE